MPSGCYKHPQKREDAEAAELAEVMASFMGLLEDSLDRDADPSDTAGRGILNRQ